jgi:hypothetical protein
MQSSKENVELNANCTLANHKSTIQLQDKPNRTKVCFKYLVKTTGTYIRGHLWLTFIEHV